MTVDNYPLIMPNLNSFSQCQWKPFDSVALQFMPFTGLTRAVDNGGALWRYGLQLSIQQADDVLGGQWQAFFRELKNKFGFFAWGDPTRRTPLGAASATTGIVRVNGAGQTGVITKTNLALWSEAIDNAAWTKNGGTITAGAAADHYGNYVLDQYVENGSNVLHNMTQGITKPASALVYTAQAVFKQSTRLAARISMATGAGANGVQADLTFATGAISAPSTFGAGWTALFSSVENLGGGLFRVTLTGLSTTATDLSITVSPLVSGSATYLGDSASGVFVGRVDVKQSESVSPYIKTEATQDSMIHAGLVVDGFQNSTQNVWRKGDHFQADGNLYMALHDSNSGPSTGPSTVLMWPPLRRKPLDNAPITLKNPMGIFRIETEADFSITQDFWLQGEPFDIVEVPQL